MDDFEQSRLQEGINTISMRLRMMEKGRIWLIQDGRNHFHEAKGRRVNQEEIKAFCLNSASIERIHQFLHPKSPLLSASLFAVFFPLLWLFVSARSLQLLRRDVLVFGYTKLKVLSPPQKLPRAKTSPERLTSFLSLPFRPNDSSPENCFSPSGNKNGSNTSEPDPFYSVAGGKGVEPLFTESESVVLPLNDPPVSCACAAPHSAAVTVIKWLGDKDSNLGSKIQNLASYH